MSTMPAPLTGNPILDSPTLKAALAAKMAGQNSPPQGAVLPPGGQMQKPSPLGPEPQGRVDMPETMPSVAPPAHPSVSAPRGTVEGDANYRSHLLHSGSGISQIAGKIEGSGLGQAHPTLGKVLGIGAQGLAQLGDIGLSTLAPAVAINTPGTAYHHQALVRGASNELSQDEANQEKEAQTKNLQTLPALHQAQLDLSQQKQNETETNHQAQIDQHLHSAGFKTDEKGAIVPLGYDEMSEQQQAVHDLKASQEELADAGAALKKVQADPNSPQARLAQQRLDGAQQARQIALQRLGLSERTFDARYQGTDQSGKALPGAMITDQGQPVGSTFSQNVRPTGQERNKSDMANSAAQQIGDMKSIIQKHPEVFGPLNGRTTDFTVWLGSQNPDAQRFRAARTIAGDHLAGTFGGRSEAALQALDNALGQFKDNPEAALAGLDQLGKATSTFQKAGTVKSVGSNAASGNSGAISVKAPNGKTYEFDNQAAADEFKQKAGIK